ncbi:MAG: DnaJ C-terminal domain-containing protein, partial [Actinomycetota bacterium]
GWPGGAAGGVPFDVGDLGDLFGGLFGGGARGGRPGAFGADLEVEVRVSFEDALDGVTIPVRVDLPRRGVDAGSRTLQVKVPAGVQDGARIRLAGRGAPGRGGAPAGDLYVRVRVRPHALFGRQGPHVTLDLPISFVEAALGAEVKVPTPTGPVTMKVPAGTPSGKVFRLRGKGAPKGGKGDLLVTVHVDVPSKLSRKEKDLLREFEGIADRSPREGLGV